MGRLQIITWRVSSTALKGFIERNPNIIDIQLCLDADDTGINACTKISKELIENKMGKGKNISVQKPKKGKDYAEYLQILKSEIYQNYKNHINHKINESTNEPHKPPDKLQNKNELHKPENQKQNQNKNKLHNKNQNKDIIYNQSNNHSKKAKSMEI